MVLIYGKNKVGTALVGLCEYLDIAYEVWDDTIGQLLSYEKYDVIIPSPGIPGTHPIYHTGKVVSELDFAYRYLPRTGFTCISVTGTDGKSTTSWILYQTLKQLCISTADPIVSQIGKKVKIGVYLSGNFDTPFSETVLEILKNGIEGGYIVLEVSSFMSHVLQEFESDYSILTNFKSDHQNWHVDLQEYLDAKMHLIEHTRNSAVVNIQCLKFMKEHKLGGSFGEQVRFFGADVSLRDRTDGENIVIHGDICYQLSETQFSGVHNAMNLLSVGVVLDMLAFSREAVRKCFGTIQGLPHRLELIAEKDGVRYVEDSKSTSSQSLEAALSSYQNPIVMNLSDKNSYIIDQKGVNITNKNLLIIVGGSDKGDHFDFLAPLFQERVKAMVCIGATKDQFIGIAEAQSIPYQATDSLTFGVSWLMTFAISGDVVMLSPGCASFGLFRDYLDRAQQFRSALVPYVQYS